MPVLRKGMVLKPARAIVWITEMSIPRPTSCVHVPSWDAELCLFPKDAEVVPMFRTGYWTFSGGICWPVPISRLQGVKVEGFACVVGLNVETRAFFVFEQRPFLTVEHVLGAGRTIEFEGLSNWFAEMWARYRCRRYYHHQDADTMGRFTLQVGRSETIEPKPWLVDCDWFDDQTALRIVWELLATQRLWHRSDEQINREIAAAGTNPKTVLLETSPALHAVCCALSGMEHSPWRKPPAVVEDEGEEWTP